jgi:hypothetical protein
MTTRVLLAALPMGVLLCLAATQCSPTGTDETSFSDGGAAEGGGGVDDGGADVFTIRPPKDGGHPDVFTKADVDESDAPVSDAKTSDSGPPDCKIGGATYPSGTANPANACQSCQPSVSASAWIEVTDGTDCESGGICRTGACASGCEVSAIYYASAAINPTNPCQTCQPAASTSAWSSVADGIPCGVGEICYAGACASGCEVSGVYSAATTANPNNPCQSCQPATNSSAWSSIADGTSCGNGQVCAAGLCGTQCDIGGTVYASGAANPTNACQTCQPGASTSMWTNAANGTSCGSGEVCNAATCGSGCSIGGTVYAAGAVNPSDACQTCVTATITTAWTNLANGTSCGTSEVCSAGSCASDCSIGGTLYASSVANPMNACQSCIPTTSTAAWSNASDGTTCGAGEVCSAGNCASGCFLGGMVYASGAANPMNACEICVPGTSPPGWSNAADGIPCHTNEVCSAGNCESGCFIGGVVYASGAANPANACQTCVPSTSPTAWVNAADGRNCNNGYACAAGVCSTTTCATYYCQVGNTCVMGDLPTLCWDTGLCDSCPWNTVANGPFPCGGADLSCQ